MAGIEFQGSTSGAIYRNPNGWRTFGSPQTSDPAPMDWQSPASPAESYQSPFAPTSPIAQRRPPAQVSNTPVAPVAPAQPATPTPPAVNPFSGGDFRGWFMSQLEGKPFNQQTLLDLEPLLNQSGSKLTPANSQGERTKIWDPTSQQWVRVGFGEGTPVWVGQGAGADPNNAYTSQFSDPSTKQLEDYVGQYLGSLQGQREKLQQAFPIDRLIEFLNGRVNQLQGPAYTPQQQQILQTQLWEPIEQQRSAQHQRDLNYASAHGWGQDSGVTKALSNQTDQAFNQIRAGAQGQEAYREIGQQQANQNQAQQILMSLYGMGNDLQQQGLPLSSLLYQLPANAQQQALAALGMAPSPQDLYQQALQLYGIQNQQRNQNASWYAGLGQLLGYLT